MSLREITNKEEYEKLHRANTIRSGHFLQSWQWGAFQESLGRKIIRFTDGTGLATVIELPLRFGKKYWFVPKGPLSSGELRAASFEFIEELVHKAKQERMVFVSIEPSQTLEARSSKLEAVESRQPKCTSIVNLTKNEDELLRAMHEKTRYNIRLAIKKGVTVERHIDSEEVFDDVWKLFKQTETRDGFHLHERAYYEKMLAAFREPNPVVPGAHTPHTITFVARYESKLLAAALVMFDGNTATYLHGASSNEDRNVMAPQALHWAIIQRAKERGYNAYDLWGISTGDEPSWEGITRFKVGFGGETVTAPGTFDLPIDGLWYSVYRLAKRLHP